MRLDDFAVRRIALLLSLLGVCGLLALGEIDRPMQIEIGEINETHFSKKVLTIGTVEKRFYTKNTLLFELHNNGTVKAVIFSPSNEQLAAIENNATIIVEGTVKEYKGKIEIVVGEVRRIA